MKFIDLLQKQKELDKVVAKTRPNGVIPRERTLLDITLALDVKFNEWLKELPKEYNFKTWKEQEYSRERELEEFTDILFFILQGSNYMLSNYELYGKRDLKKINNIWTGFRFDNPFNVSKNLIREIEIFKYCLWEEIDMFDWYLLIRYVNIAILREFTREEITEMYLKKWEKKMGRINEN